MITLQQLLMTDSDLSGGTQTGKTADGAQDFLSLLAGALTDTAGQGKEAPLTLADLKAATSKLSKAALQNGGDSALPTQLADLLARQDALSADITATTPAAPTTLQSLVSGLLPATNLDALKTLTATAQKADSKAELSEEDLAGLSALMAMLPHQQIATPATAKTAAADAVTAQVSSTPARSARPSTELNDDSTKPGQGKAMAQEPDVQLPANAAPTPVAAAAAAKQDIASASSTTAPTATLAPIVSTHSAAPPAAMVATPSVVSQPLGTHEWQQAISQHITLFTKQGQQSAELRLHPEDLGQVQISLKLDENQAQLQMVSAHGHVRAALEAALPMLRTQLAENGIQLSQSTISSESSASQQQSFSQQQHHASRSGQQGGFNDESDELLVTPAALQSAARGTGAVDIFA